MNLFIQIFFIYLIFAKNKEGSWCTGEGRTKIKGGGCCCSTKNDSDCDGSSDFYA